MARLLILLCLAIFGCFVEGFDVRRHLATQTPYFSPYTNPAVSDQCDLLHFNLLARHGSREPSTKDMNDLKSLESSLKTYGQYITNTTFDWMKTWKSPFSKIQSELLILFGEEEHYNLSKRYLNNFPTIFNVSYQPYLFPIQTTQISRTSRSASSFGFGLFENTGQLGSNGYQPLYSYSESDSEDFTLRFFDNCPLFIDQLNSGMQKAQSDAYVGLYSTSLVNKVSQRLGLNSSEWNLGIKDVKEMWTACKIDVSVFQILDHFCSVFDEQDISIFEYSEDMEYYYERSYGSSLAVDISYLLLIDFVQTMQGVIDGSLVQNAKLRFAHAETVTPFVSLLGLFRDDYRLSWNSSQSEIDNRLFRTSNLTNYAANVVFLLYNCSGEYKVQLLHNEVTYAFPGCGNETMCPLDTLLDIYSKQLAYNFTELCFSAPTPTPTFRKGWISPLAAALGGVALWLFGFSFAAVLFRFYFLRKPSYMKVQNE